MKKSDSEPEKVEAGAKRIRYRVYWISSFLATVVFGLVLFLIFIVPGVPTVQKLWMYCSAGVLIALSLVVGTWRFESTEAPITLWPAGTLIAVILGVEFIVCLAGLFQVGFATRTP